MLSTNETQILRMLCSLAWAAVRAVLHLVPPLVEERKDFGKWCRTTVYSFSVGEHLRWCTMLSCSALDLAVGLSESTRMTTALPTPQTSSLPLRALAISQQSSHWQQHVRCDFFGVEKSSMVTIWLPVNTDDDNELAVVALLLRINRSSSPT